MLPYLYLYCWLTMLFLPNIANKINYFLIFELLKNYIFYKSISEIIRRRLRHLKHFLDTWADIHEAFLWHLSLLADFKKSQNKTKVVELKLCVSLPRVKTSKVVFSAIVLVLFPAFLYSGVWFIHSISIYSQLSRCSTARGSCTSLVT